MRLPLLVITVSGLGGMAVGCSDQNSSPSDDNAALRTHSDAGPKSVAPVVHRSGMQAAQFIKDTCLRAVDESASAQQFGSGLEADGLRPANLGSRGRMTVWQIPGAEIAYTNSAKGEYDQSILCEITFDIRGAPKAAEVAAALESLLNRGTPEKGEDVGPWGRPGYRWKYSSGPGERTVVTIGDMPELPQLELPSIPPNLTVHLSHLEGPHPR